MRQTPNSKPVSPRNRLLTTPLLLVLIVLAATGCGGGGSSDIAADDHARVPLRLTSDPDRAPVIVCDLVAVNAWLDIALRIAAGDSVPPADFDQLLATPAYRAIDDAGQADNLRPLMVGQTMRDVFTTELDTANEVMLKTNVLTDDYTYLHRHLAAIPALVSERFAPKRLDALRDALLSVAPAEDWPAQISVEIFAGYPKIGYVEPARFTTDLSLALAGNSDQITRLLAGRIFHVLGPMDGVRPDLASDARGKLTGAFRMLRLDGVAAWLSHKPEVSFDRVHPRLGGAPIGDPVMLETAAVLFDRMTESLSSMLDPVSDARIETFGARLDKLLRFNERYEILGWAMVRLIVTERGEAGLLGVADNTEAFLRAYQEAALLPQSDPGLERMSPFPPGVFTDLMTLLEYP